MEGNGLSGRMYSNAGVGILGLDMPLHQLTQSPQNPQIQLQKHQQQIMGSTHQPQQQYEQQTQLSMKQPTNYISYPNPNPIQIQNQCLKTKTQLTNSDEDEPGCANDHESTSVEGGKRKGGSSMSPWQRMKWTDNMVRLLIMAVYYIGDEAGNEVGPEKKKSGSGGTTTGGGGGLLQKKGKWKSVSRAMMEKGFYVSPQQCEDKFNDLNKRYKRVNDILGKGTACKVVENQALLDSMDVSPKLKEEVRKLLNSKHLFFREMCAYHNSCGHATNSASVADVQLQHNPHQSPQQQQQQQQQQHQQQSCSHSATIAVSSTEPNVSHKVEHEDEEEEDDEDEDDEEEEEDEEDDEDHDEGGGPRKRGRTTTGAGGGIMSLNSQALQQLNGEIMGMLQDGGKNPWEKKQWMKSELMKLEEQGLKYQYQGLQLEKQRLKWIKYSSKKERQMEKLKIENERKRLENERMVLLVRQKEIELIGDWNPSSVTSN